MNKNKYIKIVLIVIGILVAAFLVFKLIAWLLVETAPYEEYSNDFKVTDSIYQKGDQVLLTYWYQGENNPSENQYTTIYAVDKNEEIRNVTSKNTFSSDGTIDISYFFHDKDLLVQSFGNWSLPESTLVATNTSTNEVTTASDEIYNYYSALGDNALALDAGDEIRMFNETETYTISKKHDDASYISYLAFSEDYKSMYNISNSTKYDIVYVDKYDYNENNDKYEFDKTYEYEDNVKGNTFSGYAYESVTAIDNKLYFRGITYDYYEYLHDGQEQIDYHTINVIDLDYEYIYQQYSDKQFSLGPYFGTYDFTQRENYVLDDEIHYINEGERYNSNSYINSTFNTETETYRYDTLFANLNKNDGYQYVFDYHSDKEMYVLEFSLTSYEGTVYKMDITDGTLVEVLDFVLPIKEASTKKVPITNFEYLQ